MQYQKPTITKLDDYLFVNGVRVCRVLPGNQLEFWDRDTRRRETQGLPRVGILDLVKAASGRIDGTQ